MLNEECDCSCHEGIKKEHITPCCWKCNKCGKNIKFLFKKTHKC